MIVMSVLGSINIDVVLTVDALPKPDETIAVLSKSLLLGGKVPIKRSLVHASEP